MAWVLAARGVLCGVAAASELRPYLPRLWQSDDGLPQNTVTAITQSRDGYLWVGTRAGLDRFDGMRFTLVDNEELKDHAVTSLCGSRDGSLWIGLESEGLLHWQGERLIHYRRTNGLGSDYVRTVCEAEDGTIWVGTGYGLTGIKEGKFKTYRQEDGLADSSVLKLYLDGRGNLWIGTIKGLNCMKNGKITESYNFTGKLPNNAISAVLEDRKGNVWFGATGGLGELRAGKLQGIYSDAKGLPGHFISALYEDRGGTLWIGAFGGLCRMREDGGFQTEVNADGGAYDQVLAIFEDREGDIWIGGRDGLSRLRARPVTSVTKRQGLSQNNVMSVLEDSQRTVWAASWGGGLDQSKSRETEFSQVTNKFPTDLLLSLATGRDSSLWVGSDHGAGLFCLKNGQITRYARNEGLTNSAIRVLHEDRRSNLWIGMTGALAVMRGGKFSYYTARDGMMGNTIRAILEDREGRIWIGSNEGLTKWEGGQFSNYTAKEGLSNPLVLALYEDEAGTLWIGTVGGGLNRLRDGKFTSYGTAQGLFSDDVFAILEDDYGYLWMSCFDGIFRVNKRSLDEFDRGRSGPIPCATYGRSEGMASVQCNGVGQPSGWKSRDGRLWFPTTKGIAVVDPSVTVNKLAPPVAIEEIIADKRSVVPVLRRVVALPPGEDGAREAPPELTLPPGRGELEISYTALSLQAPEKIRFRYELEAEDTEWREAGARRTAYYNKLRPGRYRFRVRACNNDGVWNENAATVVLILRPHFWQTWSFAGLATVAAIGMVGGTAGYAVKRRSQRKLEQLREQHLLDRERARIAKDIHDDLGSSLTRITMLSELVEADKGEPREVEIHARKIATSARQTVRALDEIVWAVSPEKDTWNSLAEYISQYAKDFFEGTGVLCRLELPLELPAYSLSSEVRHGLFLVVKEALNNILKHAQAKEARIGVRQEQDMVEIEIADDGRGFMPGRAPEGRKGSGLENMRARMEELGGRLRVESAPGKGTLLRLTIRLDRKTK